MLGALQEYRLVKAGVASYAELGYGAGNETKLLEYLAIDAEISEAQQDKDGNKN